MRSIHSFLCYRPGIAIIPMWRRSAAKLSLGGVIATAFLLLALGAWGAVQPPAAVAAGGHALHVSAESPAIAPSLRPTPQPSGGMGPADRLAPPPMSDPPTQLEQGHWEYNFSCMVCHGDQGQGLTPEWRTVLDPADQNCWQARCHGPSHPPWGFEIPKTAPMIIGKGTLTGYKTTTELFEMMRVRMPWSYPGLFDDDVYWNLTAYLASENSVDLGPGPLGPDGTALLLQPDLVQHHRGPVKTERIIAGTAAGLLLTAAALRWLAGAS